MSWDPHKGNAVRWHACKAMFEFQIRVGTTLGFRICLDLYVNSNSEEFVYFKIEFQSCLSCIQAIAELLDPGDPSPRAVF